MTIQLEFNIRYTAQHGDALYINLKHDNGTADACLMTRKDDDNWTFDLRFTRGNSEYLDYYYTVRRGEDTKDSEWTTQAHRLDVSQSGLQRYVTHDIWTTIPHDSYLYSSAFTECINRREHKEVYRRDTPASIRLKVHAPQMRSGERLILTGSHPAIGDWHIDRGIMCKEQTANEWACDIDTEYMANEDIEYKFVIVRDDDPAFAMWETGDNRRFHIPRVRSGEIEEYELPQAFFEIWNVKKAGTLIPVFSFRTKGSFGVGDFGDLKVMTDWVAYTGQRLLQILPINDTTINHTWQDSYPYSCISIFALHPQYVDFRQLPSLNDKKAAMRFESLRKELNSLRQIDYERVNKAKEEYLRLLFAQEGDATLTTEDYKHWFASEERWLVPYAMYCFLRDTYGTADFSQWPDHNTWDDSLRPALTNPETALYRHLSYYYYVQYVLAQQMRSAHEYARSRQVILKGDIPIGVHRLSCDVWQEPQYFNTGYQTGAPPDDFSVNGQNWGFPTYNWDEMLKDGCQWWVRRFQNMQKYFDAYRIDHVLGFFRIWEIPADAVHGLLGQFQPALGMTVDEITRYGITFKEEEFTQPYITKEILEDLFKERAAYVRDRFLTPYINGMYRLKEDYNTQRKVEKNVDDEALRNGLYTLVSNVLFLRDHKKPELYHPRISVHQSYAYRMLLDEHERNAFNRLYEDYFYHRNTRYWRDEAMKKLPRLVEATRMLVCAEDLGMIPECVPTVMNDLRILSLEVQSMPKEFGLRFGYPQNYPYRSVCTIDSHDMPTLRMWWDEDNSRAQEYYSQMLGRRDEAPHPLPCWLARDILSRNLQAESMLCVLSLQDWLAVSETLRLPDANAERINIPANPHHYWRYRMHLNIDDMLANHRYCDDIAEMIKQAGRG